MAAATSEGKRLLSIRRALKGGMTPTALSVAEAAKVTRRSAAQLVKMVRLRLVSTWMRDGKVRIPLCEVERLTLRRTRPALPEPSLRRRR